MLRSDFLKETAAAIASSAATPVSGHADYTISIGHAAVELAPGRVVTTTTYNGGFPGPLLRLREGRPIVVDLINETDTPEQLHWHGQRVLPYVDGAAEERTIHLHRHTFELSRVAGRTTSGVRKDVVVLGAYQETEVDFVADNPGLTLFHCHQQVHMDFGLMALFDYA